MEVNVVVGGGQAAARAVQAMRNCGFSGQIELVADEAELPYERPPLSKQFLLQCGSQATPKHVLDAKFYESHDVRLHLGARAVEVNAHHQTVLCSDGTRLRFDRLLLATGARPRRLALEGAEGPNVVYLRTLVEARALATRLRPSSRLVIIGGGFIGLEVAAAGRIRGCTVTVVEAGPSLMGRVVCPEIADFVQRYHQAREVTILTNVRPLNLNQQDSVTSVALSDGSHLVADTVLVGIGIEPDTDLALQAHLQIKDGVLTSESCVTSNPMIFAAGDVASRFNPLFGRHIRLESYQNAEDQGRIAGSGMTGRVVSCPDVPWAWSDQFDLNIQVAGVPALSDDVVVRGEVAEGTFAFLFLKQEKLVGAITVNRGRDMVLIRRMIGANRSFSRSLLADQRTSLRELIAA